MKLSGSTKVLKLLEQYPFLEDFLVRMHPKFAMLKNRMARATIGRLATLRAAAGIADLDLARLLSDLAAEIERATGERPDIEGESSRPALGRAERMEALKSIIQELHDGGDLEKARARFQEAVEDVEASEIAAMEEELIRGGLAVSEVQRLCDVHVGAFRQVLDEHPEADVPPGHPVHTYRADNREIAKLSNQLAQAVREMPAGGAEPVALARAALDALAALENHYQRKENQLFPLLERHGVTGPSQVMWGVHDQIRAALKSAREALARGDAAAFAEKAPGLARDIVEMIYKEEKILFPMALQTLSDAEWAEVRRGEDELGYALARPAADWPEKSPVPSPAPSAAQDSGGATGLLALKTGALSLEQLNLVLTHLPVDLSFVDENDTVRFYSEGPARIFPRSPAVIGRKVQQCHPPKSVHIVQKILDSFRDGKKDVAEFWIQLHGKFIHIRYFAVRDENKKYRGCLEVSQDVTAIRALQGEQRLLVWDSGS